MYDVVLAGVALANLGLGLLLGFGRGYAVGRRHEHERCRLHLSAMAAVARRLACRVAARSELLSRRAGRQHN